MSHIARTLTGATFFGGCVSNFAEARRRLLGWSQADPTVASDPYAEVKVTVEINPSFLVACGIKRAVGENAVHFESKNRSRE